MRTALRSPLADVLVLAEHAIAAPGHDRPGAGEPAGPALLLTAEHGVYLTSNGQPHLPPGSGQPPTTGGRAVHADGPGSATTRREQLDATGGDTGLIVGPALRQRHHRALIGQLRDAAAKSFDMLTVHLQPGHVAIGVARRGEQQQPR
jgi:hypothetical protein